MTLLVELLRLLIEGEKLNAGLVLLCRFLRGVLENLCLLERDRLARFSDFNNVADSTCLVVPSEQDISFSESTLSFLLSSGDTSS